MGWTCGRSKGESPERSYRGAQWGKDPGGKRAVHHDVLRDDNKCKHVARLQRAANFGKDTSTDRATCGAVNSPAIRLQLFPAMRSFTDRRYPHTRAHESRCRRGSRRGVHRRHVHYFWRSFHSLYHQDLLQSVWQRIFRVVFLRFLCDKLPTEWQQSYSPIYQLQFNLRNIGHLLTLSSLNRLQSSSEFIVSQVSVFSGDWQSDFRPNYLPFSYSIKS
jgi:hypothetical protein